MVWDPLPMTAVFYRDGKNYLPLEFSPGSRSQYYPLKEAGPLELYEKAAGAEGASTYKLVALTFFKAVLALHGWHPSLTLA